MVPTFYLTLGEEHQRKCPFRSTHYCFRKRYQYYRCRWELKADADRFPSILQHMKFLVSSLLERQWEEEQRRLFQTLEKPPLIFLRLETTYTQQFKTVDINTCQVLLWQHQLLPGLLDSQKHEPKSKSPKTQRNLNRLK